MSKIDTICFVCTGNTCRSPMAAAIAERECERRGLPYKIISGGVNTMDGMPASESAESVGYEHGLDLSYHRSSQIDGSYVSEGTVFAVMGQKHRQWLRAMLGVPDDMIYIMGDGIPDPYMHPIDVYRVTFEKLEEAMPALLDSIVGDEQTRPTVRPAVKENAEFICSLERECLGTDPSIKSMTEEIEFSESLVLVAEKNGERVGSLSAQMTPDAAYVENLCVLENERRGGVGSHLMYALRCAAYRKGCAELSLEVRFSNRTAQRFYYSLGFESMGIRSRFYSNPAEDAVVMTAKIR